MKRFRKFECFAHGSEVCSECSVDFFIANQLSKCCFTGAVLSRDTIEKFAETHFASIKMMQASGEDSSSFEFDGDLAFRTTEGFQQRQTIIGCCCHCWYGLFF
jgi:hypothetical protein